MQSSLPIKHFAKSYPSNNFFRIHSRFDRSILLRIFVKRSINLVGSNDGCIAFACASFYIYSEVNLSRVPLSDTNETSLQLFSHCFAKTSDYFLTCPRGGHQFSKYIKRAVLFMREKKETDVSISSASSGWPDSV